MTLPHVFVTRKIPKEALLTLELCCQVTIWPDRLPPSPEDLREVLDDKDGLLCLLTDRINRDLLDHAPQLRVVSTMSVGYEHIDLEECRRRQIAVGHTPGVLTDATADFALTLILASARKLLESIHSAQNGDWLTWEPMQHLGLELAQSTVGILGLGRIGSEVARRLQGFRPRLLYHDQKPDIQLEKELGLEFCPIETLVEESDILTLHVPLTSDTRHIIGERELRRMKSGGILINTGRGALIETQALVLALQRGEIGYAALDVTDPEPLPPIHPLYSCPNCMITPHVASATQFSRKEMAMKAAANLIHFFEGRPLPHPVERSP
jgi:lactate dehydrogenase-like 2-hydroxyacid dehydrogenase